MNSLKKGLKLQMVDVNTLKFLKNTTVESCITFIVGQFSWNALI